MPVLGLEEELGLVVFLVLFDDGPVQIVEVVVGQRGVVEDGGVALVSLAAGLLAHLQGCLLDLF